MARVVFGTGEEGSEKGGVPGEKEKSGEERSAEAQGPEPGAGSPEADAGAPRAPPLEPAPAKAVEAGTIKVAPEADGAVELTGLRIGRYKLLEKIGEGGFGVVYMAEQVEPVQRKVALKIIKAGMDTREVIARFEAERQALALMDHPNIAKVLDGGATEAGRPYFVMELVRGIPITDYCDRARLSTIERLELFVKVCHAVQHAHQKGIIHRDLKPSNVLVTLHDGEPVAKVIDFGVAKALGQKLTEKTLFTGFAHLVGTPAYMSPEQAALSGLDVDTRADIYSLGVLLYELLTGVTPFAKETLAKAALDEIRRMISETEPPKPSTRLRTLGDRLADVAKHRQTEPGALSRLVRGDLDWIVMKCLEKDRTRRYETANSVAVDIEHHLNHEPVMAAAPSTLYRARKFVRRHQAGLATAVALVLLLAAGVVVSTWEAVRASRAEVKEKAQRERAEAEASKRGQVARFLTDMLEGVGPSVALGRDTTMLREILDKTAERLGKDLKEQPEVEAELRSTIGVVYRALDRYPEAEAMHERALEIRRKRFGKEDATVAESMVCLANVFWGQGRYGEAEAMLRQSLAIRRKALGEENAAVANSLNDLGLLLKEEGKLAEAETVLRQSLAMEEKCLGKEHADLASTLNNLASVYWKQGRFSEAEARQRQALEMQRKLLGPEHPAVVISINNLATIYQEQGKLAEAEALQREVLAINRKLLGNDHSYVAGSLNNLAMMLRDQGKLSDAEAAQREALAIQRKALGEEHPFVGQSLCNVAALLCDQGKLAEAERMQRQALEMRRKLLGEEHPDVAQSLNALSLVLRDQGRLAEAEAMQLDALAMRRKLLGNEHSYVAISINNLGSILQAEGKLAEAEAKYREALVIRTKVFGKDHAQVAVSLEDLARVLAAQARLAEAQVPARECLAIRQNRLPDDWRTFCAQALLGSILLEQTNYSEAEPLLRSGYQGMAQRQERMPARDKVRLKQALERLVQLYQATDRLDEAARWQKLADAASTNSFPKRAAPQP